MPARFNLWRDIDSYRRHPRRDRGADQVPRPRRHRGRSRAANCPMAGSGWSISASRSAPSRRCCCSTSRWRALPPPSASASRTSSRTSPRNIPVLIVEHDIDRVLGFSARRHRDEPGRSADDRHARGGARRSPRAGGLYRHRHARRSSTAAATTSAQAPRRCCASRASTRSTARATSCTTPRSTCARARSSPCSAATAPASRRC